MHFLQIFNLSIYPYYLFLTNKFFGRAKKLKKNISEIPSLFGNKLKIIPFGHCFLNREGDRAFFSARPLHHWCSSLMKETLGFG